MKILPAGLQEHLDGGVTTLCWCWKLVRTDGVTLGFTDHDEPVTFDGITYEAVTGFTGTAVQTDLGLNVPNMDVQGALRSDQLTEADLAAGLWDNAVVELYRVNWQETSQRVLMRKGTVGEVRRGNFTFLAELRGLAHELNQEMGRLYSYSCDADLGDSRCKVNLNDPKWKGSGAVMQVLSADRWFQVSGLDSFRAKLFTGGKLTWTSGANMSRSSEVRLHARGTGGVQIELWVPTGSKVEVGDTFEVTAGCDKQFGTCRHVFNNAINFRGFPWMPSNDRVIAPPGRGVNHDGGSLFGNS